MRTNSRTRAGILGVFVVGILTLTVLPLRGYLQDGSASCSKCHIMVPVHKAWQNSLHAKVATCQDCHVPHKDLASSLAYRTTTGLRHLWRNSVRPQNQPLQANAKSVQVINTNCLRCHNPDQHPIHLSNEIRNGKTSCWTCHQEVPHGQVKSGL